MRRIARVGFALPLLLALLAPAAHAGWSDAIKKKVSDRASKKADSAVDQAIDKTEKGAAPAPKSETPASGGAAAPAGSSGEAQAPVGAKGGDAEKVSAVSTKFDFVPGDKVILSDEFREDDLGEFPARWRLAQGNFEVAEKDGERWLRCTSDDGRIRMKLPATTSLPEFWTLEFDFFATEPMQSVLTLRGVTAEEHYAWEATFPNGPNLFARSGEVISSTPLEGSQTEGRHHVMVMARGPALKIYMDRQRMANLPDISAAAGSPKELELRLWATTHPMITNVRFAEGCRPAKDALAEGKFVTYGIRFATGSDVVLPESAPVLRQISTYLEANPGVKLQITGHTDNVGSAASNLDLSKRRAASVAKVLSEQFGIGADRFSTDGKGDTAPVSKNATPEGRAMNRRVEFARLAS